MSQVLPLLACSPYSFSYRKRQKCYRLRDVTYWTYLGVLKTVWIWLASNSISINYHEEYYVTGVPPQLLQTSVRLHDVTSQKILLFIVTAVRTSDVMPSWKFLSPWIYRTEILWKSTVVSEEHPFHLQVPRSNATACLAYSSTLYVEATCSSETSVGIQRTTWLYISEIFRTTSVRTLNPTAYLPLLKGFFFLLTLTALTGPWPLSLSSSVPYIFYTDGRTPWTSDIHSTTQSQNKRIHRHSCLEWDSNPRSQRPSERRKYMP
jgi:hypothetical protein